LFFVGNWEQYGTYTLVNDLNPLYLSQCHKMTRHVV
jgi:hypothetical protein